MNKHEKSVVIPAVIGGAVEFYEVYTNLYWYPLLTTAFYTFTSHFLEFFTLGIMLIVTLISRPLGGLFFGYFGDRGGRKQQLKYSVLIITILNFLTPFLTISSSWGLSLLGFLGIAKSIQGFSVGGEMPAVFCLLAEAGDRRRRRFLCSFALLGPQIGQIVSMAQCMLFENYFPKDFSLSWGWKISFWGASLAGLIGWFFIGKIHEEEPHQSKHLSHSVHNSVATLFKGYKKITFLAFCISIFEVSGFFMIAFFLTEHFNKVFSFPPKYSAIITILSLVPIIIIQILAGKLGEKFSNKKLFKISAYIVGFSSIFAYFSLTAGLNIISLILLEILLVGMSIQFALLPSLLADMFPRSIRFTGIGLSFNLCNSLVGGMTPLVALWIVKATGHEASFLMVYPLLATIFLFVLQFIPQKIIPDWR